MKESSATATVDLIMSGEFSPQSTRFSHVDLESWILSNHPIRRFRNVVGVADQVLEELDPAAGSPPQASTVSSPLNRSLLLVTLQDWRP